MVRRSCVVVRMSWFVRRRSCVVRRGSFELRIRITSNNLRTTTHDLRTTASLADLLHLPIDHDHTVAGAQVADIVLLDQSEPAVVEAH